MVSRNFCQQKCSSSTNSKIPQFPQNIIAVDAISILSWRSDHLSIKGHSLSANKTRIDNFTEQSYSYMLWFDEDNLHTGRFISSNYHTRYFHGKTKGQQISRNIVIWLLVFNWIDIVLCTFFNDFINQAD